MGYTHGDIAIGCDFDRDSIFLDYRHDKHAKSHDDGEYFFGI